MSYRAICYRGVDEDLKSVLHRKWQDFRHRLEEVLGNRWAAFAAEFDLGRVDDDLKLPKQFLRSTVYRGPEYR
jgi:hypothetical protein